ncbi:hypothetical protein [Sphingomonas sp. IC081]|uniref:hypothetical protein n=1 Tax=Sphingomonas sp. IC081 TaxID=304378 RepID=UPI001158FE92|nr:hypothetical protein [Sphingomonas sp. IC081]QDK34100.1 hypothetical protein DM450_15230 [Sphingomonas sp. IC081]
MGKDAGAARAGNRWSWPVLAALPVAIAAVWLRIAHFSPFEIMHADELMQYLEQGNRLATGRGLVPWEAHYGLRGALIEQFVALFLWMGHLLSDEQLFAVRLARAAFGALTLLTLPAAWRLGALSSRRHALVALFVASVWWEAVLFSDLLLSESLASALILLAAAPLLTDDDSSRHRRASDLSLLTSGFLLGLGVLARLQYAPFVAVLAIAALRLDWRRWRPVVLGGLAAALLGAASDLAMGRVPFAWIMVNVAMNIGHGIASRFGVSGPFAYLIGLYTHLAPIMVPLLVAALLAGRRYWPLMAAATVNVLIHSMIAHKEYRFIWLSTLTVLILAAIATVRLADRLAERRGGIAGPAGIAIVCLAWLGASFASEYKSGGYPAFRGGGAVPRLALRALDDPGTCAIALDFEIKAHLVPALLPRPVPILLVPTGGRPLSGTRAPGLAPELAPGLARGANALILATPDTALPGWHREACEAMGDQQACLFRREGTCAPAPQWSYQKMIDIDAGLDAGLAGRP